MTDRWTLTVAGLCAEPWPPLPALPGRVIECRDEPLPEAERAEILASDIPAAEAALLLVTSRQRIHQLRAEKAQKDVP